MCARLKLGLLRFSQAATCLPATAVPVLPLPGQEAECCGGASVAGTWGVRRPAAQPGTCRLPRTERSHEACARRLRTQTLHLCVPGVSARARAFHLPAGKVAACLGPPGIRHVARAVVGRGLPPDKWPHSSLCTCATFLGEKEEHVEEQPQR